MTGSQAYNPADPQKRRTIEQRGGFSQLSKVHFDAFLADVKRRARVRFTESKSSIRGLVEFLRTDQTSPQPLTYDQAIGKLANRWDPRLNKYQPCIRRVVAVWGTPQRYGDAATQVLSLGPREDDSADNILVFDNQENVRRFAAAYCKARFFHGCRRSTTEEAMTQGLKIDESCSAIGASDPGQSVIPGGGPIFLGERYSIAQDYGGSEANVLRVFLDSTRVTWPIPDRGHLAKFERNNHKVFRDHDNPRAVYTMADIPGIAMFCGKHSDVIQPDLPRTTEILRAIGSHDVNLPKETSALLNLHAAALEQGMISDSASGDANPRR